MVKKIMAKSKRDRETHNFLESLADYLRTLKRGEYVQVAKAAGLHPSTIGRLHKDDKPNRDPKSLTIFPVLKAISGKFPLKFKGNELLSNLDSCSIGYLAIKISEQTKGLTLGDIKLLFQFLDILRNRSTFKPDQFGLLKNTLSTLHGILINVKGLSAVTELTSNELEQFKNEIH